MPKLSQFLPAVGAAGSDTLAALRNGADILVTAASVATMALPLQGGNIMLYGAVPGNDAAAAISAAAAVNSLVIIPAGTWPIVGVPTIPAGVVLEALPGANFSGAGAASLGLTAGALIQIIEYASAGSDFATNYYFRNAQYSGGTPGNTISALRLQDNVGANVTNYEWTLTSILNNSATAGQNVAIYGQGNKQTAGAGPTWAGVMEARDVSGAANPTKGLIGMEIDVRASGGDSGLNRVGLDLVLTRYPFNSGSAATIAYGMRVGSFGDAGVTVGAGYTVLNTTVGYAFDCANATVTGGALRMPSGAAILFDVSGVNQVLYDGTGLTYKVSGSSVWRVNQNGLVNIGSGAFGLSGAMTSQVTGLIGTSQSSYQMSDTLSGTTVSAGLLVQQAVAASTTVVNYRGTEIKNPSLGSSALITNCSGIYVNNLTSGGSQNAALNLNVVAGANKYNVYAPGTAQNFMQGPLGINGAVAPSQVTGWGAPTGAAIISAFPGAAATLPQTSSVVAEIIAALLNFGLFGA